MSRHVHMPPPIVYTAVPKKIDETRRRPGLSGVRKADKGKETEEDDSVENGESFGTLAAGSKPRPSFDAISEDLPERKRFGTGLLSDESLKAMLQIQEKKTP